MVETAFNFCFPIQLAPLNEGILRRVAALQLCHAHLILGRAVQVDPIKSTLKAPGIKLLKLKYGKPLSIFAFEFSLRRYNLELLHTFIRLLREKRDEIETTRSRLQIGLDKLNTTASQVGAYTRPLFSST
jgi:hypothetical protein